MNEKELKLGELDLDDILKEFGDADDMAIAEAAASSALQELLDSDDLQQPEMAEPAGLIVSDEEDEDLQIVFEEAEEEQEILPAVTDDTIRLDDLAQMSSEAAPKEAEVTFDTIRLDDLNPAEAPPQEDTEEETAAQEESEETEEAEADSEAEEAEPEPEEFVPAAPIVFDPRAKLRELKRKLVAGPERRYYELSEIGVGKLQVAMFLCLVIIAVSCGTAVMYSMELIPENRMRLMVFGQVLAMLLGALLGCYQMLDGLGDLLRGKFTANTLLAITFFACCADSLYCLQEERVPICAAFTLEVMMSLWNTYHKRTTEMGMMDTMRKAVRLHSVVKAEDYYEGKSAVLRGSGEVEDFMDHYNETAGPEKVQNTYALIALIVSIGIAVAAGILHGVSLGVQMLSTTLLVAMPASFFIALSRPMAVLERRLHTVGTVFCGWKGVVELSRKCLYPLSDADIFPLGSVKMNGVKFYGERNPETVIAYAAALMKANGGSLAPIFEQLLASRNGIRFAAENVQFYGNGGIGGEINGEPVLMGTMEFLQEMGVEIPEGTMVKQAVYVSVDGDLSGLFAITYNRAKSSAAGMTTICSARQIRSVIIAKDFLMTPAFLKEFFGLRQRRAAFPARAEALILEEKQPDPAAPALALTTQDSLASAAYAITGARALRTACRMGLTVHILGGVLGLLIMAALAVLGATALLTPIHILLYQLVWIIPGYLVTMWTRAI